MCQEKKRYVPPTVTKHLRLQKVTLGTVSDRPGKAPDNYEEAPQSTGCSGDWKTLSKWH